MSYEEERAEHERDGLALLTAQSPDQPWWLGYLDTGVDDNFLRHSGLQARQVALGQDATPPGYESL